MGFIFNCPTDYCANGWVMRIIVYVFNIIVMLINMGLLAYIAINFYRFSLLLDGFIIPVFACVTILLTVLSVTYSIFLFEKTFFSKPQQMNVSKKKNRR
jgi:hypothetical protein